MRICFSGPNKVPTFDLPRMFLNAVTRERWECIDVWILDKDTETDPKRINV